MSRDAQPSIAFSIASARASSTRKSAGPPMPKEVRDASGSSSLTPGCSRSQARLVFVRQVIAQLLDIARAHEQNEVVRADDLLESFFGFDEVADVDAVRDLVCQVGGADAGNVLLARAVHVQHVNAVGAVERARKAVHQRAQTGVTVRLEDHEQAAVTELAGRLDRRAHLRRVVRVVVVNRRALEDAEKLQAAMGAGERVQRRGDVVESDADLESHRGRSRRVLDVVAAGLPQVDVSQQVDAAIDRKRTGMLAAIRSALAKAVGDLARLRLELARELVIRAQHREPALRQAFDEPLEQVADRAHVAEVVGMVELDVRDDRPLRVVERKRAVRLVRLGDEPLGLARARARSVAHQHGRVVAGDDQDMADHVRDGRLAGGAGDGDRVRVVDHLREHLGAAQDLDPHRAGGVELRRLLDRAAVDEQVLAKDVFGVVAEDEFQSLPLELGRRLRLLEIASADFVSPRQEDPRQRGHSRTADAHEMSPHRRTTSCSTASTRCAASWRPAAAEALAIARIRSASRPSIVRRRLSPSSSSSAILTAAPALTMAAAFSSWWPPPNVPGTSTMGSPTAAASAMVPTPARPTIRSARAINAAMSSVKAIPR